MAFPLLMSASLGLRRNGPIITAAMASVGIGKGADTAVAVRAEEIRTLYRQSPWIMALNAINVAIVGVVLWSPARSGLLVGWILASALTAVARAVLRRRYLQESVPIEEAPRWGRRYTAGAALSGLLWGAGSVLLYDPR